MWFSKHHYAYELSKNNEVYFINAPGKWKWKNIFQKKAGLKQIKSNLQVVEYKNFIPLTGRIRFLCMLNEKWILSLLAKSIPLKEKKPIFWSFDPHRFFSPKLFNAVFSIYHSVEYYTHKRENWLCKNVNMILCVSDTIKEKLSKFNKPVFTIPHGISEEIVHKHFEKKSNNIVIMAGSINYRLDYELLDYLTSYFPNVSFMLIGPVDKQKFNNQDHLFFDKLSNKKNIFFTGKQSMKYIYEQIGKSTLCICAYKQDQLVNQLNSLKVIQYLGMGKPVITNYLKEYESAAKEKIVYISTSKETFSSYFEKILNGNEEEALRLKRITFASKYSYTKLIKKIEQYITKCLEEKSDVNS